MLKSAYKLTIGEETGGAISDRKGGARAKE